jgi:hypothetical protein
MERPNLFELIKTISSFVELIAGGFTVYDRTARGRLIVTITHRNDYYGKCQSYLRTSTKRLVILRATHHFGSIFSFFRSKRNIIYRGTIDTSKYVLYQPQATPLNY